MITAGCFAFMLAPRSTVIAHHSFGFPQLKIRLSTFQLFDSPYGFLPERRSVTSDPDLTDPFHLADTAIEGTNELAECGDYAVSVGLAG
jgi:hypothetical protein